MLKWFRRQRLLAALLVTANPAIIGSWVTAYHPCPVRDGVVAHQVVQVAQASAMEQMGHDHMAEAVPAAPSHGHDQHDAPCSCIGQCLTSGVALVSIAGDELRVATEITPHLAPRASHAELSPASAPPYLLPPSTAPPTAQ